MDSINMPTWLTPSFVATGLTILSIVVILIGFLIGFIRGTYRASYRFIVFGSMVNHADIHKQTVIT